MKSRKKLTAFAFWLTGSGQKGDLTLLYGARDQVHNEALVIKDFIS